MWVPLDRMFRGEDGRHIPFVRQMTNTDCGVACLAMILRSHGRHVLLEELRQAAISARDGTNAAQLLALGRQYGLHGRGVSVEIDQLDQLPRGSILHWQFRHFVVLLTARERVIEILDPAIGRRTVSIADFRRAFTGVALIFTRTPDLRRTRPPSPIPWRELEWFQTETRTVRRVIATSVFLQVLALTGPLVTAVVIDKVIPRQDYRLLWLGLVAAATAIAFQFIASLVRGHLLVSLRANLDTVMTARFADHLLRLPFVFYQGRSVGDILHRLNSNSTVRDMLTTTVLTVFLDATTAAVYLAVLLMASPWMFALASTMALAHFLTYIASRSPRAEAAAQLLSAQARSQSYQVEMFSAIESLKAMGCETQALQRWTDLFLEEVDAQTTKAGLEASYDALLAMLRLGAPTLIMIVGSLAVLMGQLTLGEMVASAAMAGAFLMQVSTLTSTASRLQPMASYLERINDVLGTAPEQSGESLRPAGHLAGLVEVARVSFRFAPHQRLVIQECSFTAQPGQFVAIVGASGSGKSTLLRIILGLYQPTEGSVSFDGADIRGIDIRSLRRQIGVVTQQSHLFAGSIRANIEFAEPSASLERVVEAATRAHIHPEISMFPLAYDTPLGDRGSGLSGGQQQRVTIARALLREPAVLLLDEATSALDSLTERALHEQLAEIRCTRIVVAQRLSTIAAADEILVLEAGRIAERGTHQSLLALDGQYARMWAAQVGRAAPQVSISAGGAE